MSLVYRVEVQPSKVTHVHVEQSDRVLIDVALLPVVGDEAMRQMLLEELGRDGWVPAPAGGRHKDLGDGLVAVTSADGRTVTISATARRAVGGSGFSDAEADLVAARNAAAAADTVRREATERLARVEGDVRATIEAATQRVYVEALQQKARSLGHVESLQRRDGDDGVVEITIKVRA